MLFRSVRSMIGLKPSSDPRADQLLNPNVNTAADESADLDLSQVPEDGEYEDEEVADENSQNAATLPTSDESEDEEDYPEPRDEDTAAFIENYKRLLKGVKQ